MSARRAFLRGLAAAPLAGALALDAPAAAGEDATSAQAALDALERLAAGVAARLRALDARVPAARAFLSSALHDHERLAQERRELRRRLRLSPPPAATGADEAEPSLAGLREAQDALVYAHAEALPALGDPAAVDRLARHLVEFARHLTVIDLWIAAEEQRG